MLNIFDYLLDALVVLDAKAKIIYCNEAFGTFLDLPIQRIKPKSALSEFLDFEPDLMLTSKAKVKEGSSIPYKEVNFTSKRRSGRAMVAVIEGKQKIWPKAAHALIIKDLSLEVSLDGKYRIELQKQKKIIGALEDAEKQLQSHASTLEVTVEQRTQELRKINEHLSAILNSVRQAFLITDGEGNCLETYSKACTKLFDCDPNNKPLSEVLKIEESQRTSFGKWVNAIFEKKLPFADLASLGPKSFVSSKGLTVQLEYFCVKGKGGVVQNLVVVGTDITKDLAARKALDNEKLLVKQIISAAKDKEGYRKFIKTWTEKFAAVVKGNDSAEERARTFHNFAPEAKRYGFERLAEDANVIEKVFMGRTSMPEKQTYELIDKLRSKFDEATKEITTMIF